MKVRMFFSVLIFSLFSVVSLAAQLNDGQIVQTLIVLNTNEIDAGNLALKDSSNPNVKKFAQLMIKDHTKNRQETRNLANTLKLTPIVSVNSANLMIKGKKLLAQLKVLSGKDFDQTYIDGMVKDHEEALDLIDKDLLPDASNPKLVKHLKTTRATIAHHLDMAKDTQKELS